ncbi:MAG: HD family phosphohydrolase, partial [Clostridium sp.]
MRRIPLRYLQENSITAMDIYNPNGKLLISKGLKIDKDMIELLKKNKIIYIYIMDESREDIID